jgi:hypothetical protein
MSILNSLVISKWNNFHCESTTEHHINYTATRITAQLRVFTLVKPIFELTYSYVFLRIVTFERVLKRCRPLNLFGFAPLNPYLKSYLFGFLNSNFSFQRRGLC